MTRWGLVATIRAPMPAVLGFAAWHLEQGAERLYLYLDDPAPETLAALQAHPKICARHTDVAWWQARGGRPPAHQLRQTANARHAANRTPEVDWLAHIDVDEFLLPDTPVADQLAALPPDCLCARMRPIEALAPGDGTAKGETAFKALHPDPATRQRAAEACFPTWGAVLPGGFLSHVAGKLFLRPGAGRWQPRIHNVFLDGDQNPGQRDLPGIALGHFHAADWDQFIAAYRFRLAQGSYRAELKPQVRDGLAPNLHGLFTALEDAQGEAGLRAFFDEVCTGSAALCARLEAQGLLRRHRIDLEPLRARHFSGTLQR